ncbi:hypothetical protein F5Y10DRAFT_244775 [Nemania abortiva]|nr:hypothetical protein F5Y10DRAFT_244775 [Nemania abortiva]
MPTRMVNNYARDVINNNGDNNEVGSNNNNNNDNTTSSSTATAINGSEATFDNATKAITTATIVIIVFLAVQVIVFGTLLTIWLRKRNQRRIRERQRIEEYNAMAPYLPPGWTWGLPSSTQQHLRKTENFSQSPWQEVPPSNSPTHFPLQDTSGKAAQSLTMATRFNNRETPLEFSMFGANRGEMAA